MDGTSAAFAAPRGFEMLSVVMPCYRLAATAEANVRAVADLLDRGGVPHEIVPVDDGSGDGTDEALLAAARALGGDRVRPVLLPENGGKGAALVAGFRASRGTHVLLLDGDLDLAPDRIWDFFEIMRRDGADVVIGSKMHPESKIDYPLRRRFASLVYYSLVRALLQLPVHDTQTGMKLFTRESLDFAFSRMVTKRYAFDLEVLAIARDAGYRVSEAPIELDYHGRAGALTARNVRDVLVDTAAIFWRARLLRYYKAAEPHAMPEKPATVTAVIACPGASGMLRQCVEALAAERAAVPAAELEAIVLPDAPTGESWPPWVREIPTGRILPSEKRNAGIREARGEVVAFLDDDARPLPGWLAHALPWFGVPEVGGVGGPAVTPRDDPPAAKLSGRVYENPLVSGGARRRYFPTAVRDEDDLPSCNLLVRASLLRRIGGYSSAHWPGEDTFLCRALVYGEKARLVYDPQVIAAHHRRPLFGPHLRQVSRYARHRGFFARRYPENSRRPAYFAPSLLLLGTIGEALCAAAWALFRTGCFGCASGDARRACALYELVLRGPAAFGAAVLAFYALAVLAVSFSPRLRTWAWTAAGVVTTHYAYGWNFLRGFLSRSMPDGVKDFDHQGGNGTPADPARQARTASRAM